MKTRHFPALVLSIASVLAGVPAAAKTVWLDDARGALAKARASGKPVLVDLYADWCGWCMVLEARVFSTSEFAAFARDFVLLRVDVEDGGEGSEIAARYRSGSLPTLLVLEPTGALVGEVVGYHETVAFIDRIRGAFAIHEKVIESHRAALASDDDSRVAAAARDLYLRLDGARAAPLYARLEALRRPAGDEAAWLRYYRADSLRLAREFEAARREAAAAARLGNGTRDAVLAERLELLPFWIARDEERCGDARALFTGFETRHPRSAFLRGARSALDRLRSDGEVCS